MKKVWSVISFALKNWHYAIGLIVLALVLSRIDISQTAQHLLAVNKFYYGVSAMLSFPFFFLKALRWRYLMQKLGIRYSIPKAASMYFSGVYLGLVTPGRVAELARVMYLKRDGHSVGKAFFSVFFDRFFDVASLAMIAIFGMLFFAGLLSIRRSEIYAALLILAAACLFVFAVVPGKIFRSVLVGGVKLLLSKKFGNAANASIDDFLGSLSAFSIKTVAVAAGFTLLSISFYCMQAYLLAAAAGIKISFVYLIFAVSVSAFVSVLPVSILGIGTRDAAFLYLFTYVGIAKELAVTYSALVFFNILVLAVVCARFWFKNPVPLVTGGQLKTNPN